MSMFLAMAALVSAHAPFPVRAGQCAWVRGRFRIANGSSIQRIWVVGTRHVLALYDDDEYYPPALQRLVHSDRYRPFETAIHGEFLVCARERWIAGHMQHVRFKSARHLVTQ